MAGTDSEMVSTYIRDYGEELLDDGRITMTRLDDAVRRILRVKFRAGLFENPYVDVAAAKDAAQLRQAGGPDRPPATPPPARWCCSRTTGTPHALPL